MGELLWRGAGALEPEDVADACGRGNYQSELCGIRRRAKTDDGLVAAGHISFLAADNIEGAQVRFALLSINGDQVATVGRPDRRIVAAAAGRGVVSAHT